MNKKKKGRELIQLRGKEGDIKRTWHVHITNCVVNVWPNVVSLAMGQKRKRKDNIIYG